MGLQTVRGKSVIEAIANLTETIIFSPDVPAIMVLTAAERTA